MNSPIHTAYFFEQNLTTRVKDYNDIYRKTLKKSSLFKNSNSK